MASHDIKVENGPDYHIDDQEDVKSSSADAQIDPFGSEESAEVQYKTMAWWYVMDSYSVPQRS